MPPFTLLTPAYAVRDPTAGWSIETVDHANDSGQFAALTLDQNDRPHLAYLDSDAGILRYAVRLATDPTPTPAPKSVTTDDQFEVTAILDNPGPALADIPVVCLLDVDGQLFFWPSWRRYQPDLGNIDFQRFDVYRGSTSVTVIPTFTWPDLGDDRAEGIWFHAPMLSPGLTTTLGAFDSWAWSYGPSAR